MIYDLFLRNLSRTAQSHARPQTPDPCSCDVDFVVDFVQAECAFDCVQGDRWLVVLRFSEFPVVGRVQGPFFYLAIVLGNQELGRLGINPGKLRKFTDGRLRSNQLSASTDETSGNAEPVQKRLSNLVVPI